MSTYVCDKGCGEVIELLTNMYIIKWHRENNKSVSYSSIIIICFISASGGSALKVTVNVTPRKRYAE
jgi:hypothetical protein